MLWVNGLISRLSPDSLSFLCRMLRTFGISLTSFASNTGINPASIFIGPDGGADNSGFYELRWRCSGRILTLGFCATVFLYFAKKAICSPLLSSDS